MRKRLCNFRERGFTRVVATALCLAWATHHLSLGAAEDPSRTVADPAPSSLGDADGFQYDFAPTQPPLGEGFAKGTYRVGWSLGYGSGPAQFGSSERHDLLLTSLQLGWMASRVVGKDRFYRGNWELMVEVLGAWQFEPRDAFVASFTPMLRYNFATGSRWVPFIEAGAGVLVTDIGGADLSTEFQFHSVAGVGTLYRFDERVAVGFETRFGHISNAGIEEPNRGVNEFEFIAGVSWFF
jgi:hypothetical protein